MKILSWFDFINNLPSVPLRRIINFIDNKYQESNELASIKNETVLLTNLNRYAFVELEILTDGKVKSIEIELTNGNSVQKKSSNQKVDGKSWWIGIFQRYVTLRILEKQKKNACFGESLVHNQISIINCQVHGIPQDRCLCRGKNKSRISFILFLNEKSILLLDQGSNSEVISYQPQTDCPDLSRSNGKLKRKYKFDRELLKYLKIKIAGHDDKDCFGTAEIINFGKIKSDLEMFEAAFHQSEIIVDLIEEYKANVQDSDE